MAEPLSNDFALPAAPGGGFPAIMGIPAEEETASAVGTEAAVTTVAASNTLVMKTTATPRTSDTTLTADTYLRFGVVPTYTYWPFQAYLVISAVNTTMDCKLGWSLPSGWTMTWSQLANVDATNVWVSRSIGNTPGLLLTESDSIQVATNNGLVGAVLVGFAKAGAAASTGDVALTWAQNTSDAGALDIAPGSYIVVVGRV